jgi:hypothetical protein
VSDQHTRFQLRLVRSRPAVDVTADWLRQLGYEVEVPDMRVAPTADQHEDFADQGDIRVTQIVEVKGLGINFTGAHDWPFREVFVSSVSSVDRPMTRVMAWVNLSKDLQYAAIIPRDTRPSWYVREVKLSTTGNVQLNYCCPTKLVIFCRRKESDY